MGTIVEKKDEHILVCLSSSPTNKKIISTAAKMAGVFHARFTALYVQTGAETISADKERLEAHIRYAEESGAEIVMTHGEDVACLLYTSNRQSDSFIVLKKLGNANGGKGAT